MAFLRWFIGFVITVLICVFAVLNREEVTVYVDPLYENISFSLPIYALVMIAMAFGFLFGGMIVWLNASGVRRERRRQKKEIRALEKEVERLKEDKFTSNPPAAEIFPAIAAK